MLLTNCLYLNILNYIRKKNIALLYSQKIKKIAAQDKIKKKV